MNKIVSWLPKLALFSIFLFVCFSFIHLGRDYLFDWDEGIYAQISVELLKYKNFLSPTWNSELWLEKPPLLGWLTALSMQLFGVSEFGARFFMPIFGGLTLLAVFKIGSLISGPIMGVTASAILGYFNLFLSRSRTLNTDGLLLACISWVAYLLLSGASAVYVGLIMGLAIMVKGPAGILAIFIALPLLIHKSKKYLLTMTYSLLILVLPWHLYAYFKHGMDFVTPYLFEQVLRRATVPIEFHLESRWFYFVFIYKDLGLGIILVSLTGYFLMFKKWLAKTIASKELLLIFWVFLPLAIFTLAKTRLSWYILPVYPGIALSIGYALSALAKTPKSKIVVSILALGMLTQMLWHSLQYIDYKKSTTSLSDTLTIANSIAKYEGGNIAMLVSPSERVAQAILPQDQAISSSFRYGGAPSVVYYSKKKVHFYYNYDLFVSDQQNDPSLSFLIVTTPDLDKVQKDFKEIAVSGTYHAFIRGGNYALR